MLIGYGGGPFPRGDRDGGRRLTPLFAFNNDRELLMIWEPLMDD